MMLNSGKCPKCERSFNSVKLEHIDVTVNRDPKWLRIPAQSAT